MEESKPRKSYETGLRSEQVQNKFNSIIEALDQLFASLGELDKAIAEVTMQTNHPVATQINLTALNQTEAMPEPGAPITANTNIIAKNTRAESREQNKKEVTVCTA
jgi:hypothetical protein